MLSEPHVFKDALVHPEAAKQGYYVPPAEKSTVLGTLKHCHTCRCFPKSAAERQKAYRERHKAKS